MIALANYPKLISTNGAVSLMRAIDPKLPPFAVRTEGKDGEILDTFTDRASADEFATDAADHIRKGITWPGPGALACTVIYPSGNKVKAAA